METFFAVLLFAAGLFAIIKGGDFLVNASLKISRFSGISEAIIGATLVSIATTLPEVLVSAIASAKGEHSIAVGNALGSIIANTGLVLGISLAFVPAVFSNNNSRKKIAFLVSSLILFFGISLDGIITLLEGLLLLIIFAAFMHTNFCEGKAEAKTEIKNSKTKTEKLLPKQKMHLAGTFVLGAVLIFVGANFMVDNGAKIAQGFGISKELVGLTIIALGTSLPELVTTITAVKKKKASLALGNIIGANIINLTLLMGLSAVLSGNGLLVRKSILVFTMPVLFLISLTVALPVLFKHKTYKWQGYAVIALNFAYIIMIFALNI